MTPKGKHVGLKEKIHVIAAHIREGARLGTPRSRLADEEHRSSELKVVTIILARRCPSVVIGERRKRDALERKRMGGVLRMSHLSAEVCDLCEDKERLNFFPKRFKSTAKCKRTPLRREK